MKKLKVFVANLLAKVLGWLVKGSENFLPFGVYKLLTDISPITCVDMIPCRLYEGRWQLGLITRNTGFFKGKFWIIGGRVNLGEHLLTAIRRHVRDTLGVEVIFFAGLNWNKPAFIVQYDREPGKIGFGWEPTKHCVSSTYLIHLTDDEVKLGKTDYGGQEASRLDWFNVDELPPKENFAYGGYETTILRAVSNIRKVFPNNF